MGSPDTMLGRMLYAEPRRNTTLGMRPVKSSPTLNSDTLSTIPFYCSYSFSTSPYFSAVITAGTPYSHLFYFFYLFVVLVVWSQLNDGAMRLSRYEFWSSLKYARSPNRSDTKSRVDAWDGQAKMRRLSWGVASTTSDSIDPRATGTNEVFPKISRSAGSWTYHMDQGVGNYTIRFQ
jgi:hypothetical protein